MTNIIQFAILLVMLFTMETDYALRIIRELGRGRGGRKTLDEICKNEQIPRHFSYKILKKLEKSGMVRIFRGVGGGYALAADTGGITIFDVIASIDGDILLSECLGHRFDCSVKKRGKKICGVHRELGRIQSLLLGHLKEKPLAEIF